MQERLFRLFLVFLTVISPVFMAISVFAVEKPLSDGKVAVVNGTLIPRAEFDRGRWSVPTGNLPVQEDL